MEDGHLRICMIIHSFFPLVGGSEVYAQSLAKRLVNLGHKVTVLTLGVEGCKNKEFIDGIEVIRISAPRIPVFRLLFYFLRIIFELLKRRGEFDVIHSYQTYTAGFISAIGGKLTGTPTIIREGSESVVMLDWCSSFVTGMMIRYAIKNTDKIYSNNAKLVPILKDAGAREGDTDVLFTPTELEMFRPPKNKKYAKRQVGADGKFVVLYAGRLVSFKNVNCLIMAIPDMIKAIPNLGVIIAGYGSEKESLERLAKRLGVSEHVTFTGKVPFNDISKYYQAADVFVHPAISMELYKTLAFPATTVYQAMASGIPVISSPDHQFSKKSVPITNSMVVMESGIGVKPDSPECLSQAVVKLFRSESLRTRLGKTGRRIAEKELNWETHTQSVILKYYDLIRNSGRLKRV